MGNWSILCDVLWRQDGETGRGAGAPDATKDSDGEAMSELSPSNAPTSPIEPVPAAERPSRGRSVAVVVCVVLAGLLTTPAAVAYWGQRTLNDTERYVATVDPLVASPEVQDVIATKVTDAIEKQVDIEAILNNVFAGVITDRPRLEQLVGPLSAAINGLIDREVRDFIASDEFADLWVRVNTRAQQALHRILTGEGSGLSRSRATRSSSTWTRSSRRSRSDWSHAGSPWSRTFRSPRPTGRSCCSSPTGSSSSAPSTPSATRWPSGCFRWSLRSTWSPSHWPGAARGWAW